MVMTFPMTCEGIEVTIDGKRYFCIPVDEDEAPAAPVARATAPKKTGKPKPKKQDSGKIEKKESAVEEVSRLLKRGPFTTAALIRMTKRTGPCIYSVLTALRKNGSIEDGEVDGMRVNKWRAIIP